MNFDINWLAVVLAVIVGMVPAGAWYTSSTFGPSWRKLTGITEKDSAKAGNTPMVLVLVSNIVTTIALAIAISASSVYFNDDSLGLALIVGFITWLAFSATTLLTHNAFEQKSMKLTVINNGYQLALFMTTALVLGLLR